MVKRDEREFNRVCHTSAKLNAILVFVVFAPRTRCKDAGVAATIATVGRKAAQKRTIVDDNPAGTIDDSP